MNYQEAADKLKLYNQEHVLAYYDRLSDGEKEELLSQIKDTDFSVLASCLSKEEKELKKTFHLTDEQIMWRRWSIKNNCGGDIDKFHQEYPATPEEAFIATGTGVFDNKAIIIRLRMIEEEAAPRCGRFTYKEERQGLDRIILRKIKFSADERGEILIFKEPVKGRPYTLGGDTAGEEATTSRRR